MTRRGTLVALAVATAAAFAPQHAVRRPAPRRSAAAAAAAAAAAVDQAGGEAWFAQRSGDRSGADSVVVLEKGAHLSTFMKTVWGQLHAATGTVAVLGPECAALDSWSQTSGVIEHLEMCKDACERFGTEFRVLPLHPDGPPGSQAPAPGILVQPIEGGEGGYDMIFNSADDDLWDDFDDSGIAAKLAALEGGGGTSWEDGSADDKALAVVPESDAEVVGITERWCDAVIAGLGVCPFAVSAQRAGLPVGPVSYPLSRAKTAEEAYQAYWAELETLLATDVSVLSTTLLVLPEFELENLEAFDLFAGSLTATLTALGAKGTPLEDEVQLVFFHPKYLFRDGQARTGDDAAANFARRSPFPIVNILRTPQVRKAQRAIPTGLVYKQNEDTLKETGTDALQAMLVNRDWEPLKDKKVDRKRVEVLQTALKLQSGEATVEGVEASRQAEGFSSPAAAGGAAAAAAAAGGGPLSPQGMGFAKNLVDVLQARGRTGAPLTRTEAEMFQCDVARLLADARSRMG